MKKILFFCFSVALTSQLAFADVGAQAAHMGRTDVSRGIGRSYLGTQGLGSYRSRFRYTGRNYLKNDTSSRLLNNSSAYAGSFIGFGYYGNNRTSDFLKRSTENNLSRLMDNR